MSTQNDAELRIGANVDGLIASLRQAQETTQAVMQRIEQSSQIGAAALKNVGMAMAGLAAGVTFDAMRSQFESIVQSAAGLKDMAEKTGASVEKLSALSAVAKITGQDMNGVEQAMARFAKGLAGSDDEAKGLAHAMSALGLSVKDLRLMDQADALKLVADKLALYQDGAGKTALAMDSWGKSGAQLLPYLKNLAESGDLVAKTTTAQTYAADEYEKNLKRLTATKNALYKTISMELIPVFNAFTKALIEVNNETDGVRQTAKTLAQDGSITSWAVDAAKATAFVVDELQLIGRIAIEIATPIERVGRNIYTLGALASIAITGNLSDKQAAFSALKAENEKYFADLDARLANNRQNTPLFSDRLNRQLEELGKARSALGDDGKQSLGGYKSKAPTIPTIKNQADTYGAFLDQLDRMQAKLENNEYVMLKVQAAQKAYAEGLTATTALQKIDALQVAENTKAIGDYMAKVGEENQKLANKRAAIGLTGIELDVYNLREQRRAEVMAKINELERAGKPLTDDARQALITRSQAASDAAEAILRQNAAIERSYSVGVKRALDTYVDNATNAAKNVESLIAGSFSKMEDALVKFAQTGKINFKELANSIIADMIRIQARQSMSGLANLFGSTITGWLSGGSTASGPSAAAGGGSWLGTGQNLNMSAGSSLSLPSFDVGTNYVPQDMIAMIHKGEQIVPAAYNPALNGGGVTVNIINSAGAQTRQEQRPDGRGGSIIDVFVEQARGAIASDIARGTGAVPAALQGTYGLNRTAGAY